MRARAAELCDAVNQNVDELMRQLDQERRYHKAVVSALLGCFYKAVPEYRRTSDVEQEVCDFLSSNYFFDLYFTKEEDLLEQAIAGWTALGDEGHSFSLFNLGVCFQRGFGVPQDPVSAAELFKNAADLGYKFGKRSFAQCLRDGNGVAKNEEEAAEYFMAVFREHGGRLSGVDAAQLLWKCRDVAKRREALWPLMVNALDGYEMSHQKFVEFISDQRARDVDIPEICQKLKSEAAKGNAEAQFLYGICLLNGKAAPEDSSSANASPLEEAQENAEPDNNDGNVVDGPSHEQERSSDTSALAVKMLEAAALQGHSDARYHYWLCWRDHVSNEAKEKVAQDFLIAAKNDGHMRALGDWAISLKRNSKNVDEKTRRAIVDCLKQAGNTGYAEASYQLGLCYLEGFAQNKVSKADRNSARDAFKRAADAGHIEASYQLAKLMMKRKDWEKIAAGYVPYFKAAAEAGHVEAQYEYARCLESGIGCSTDIGFARYYYQMAAEAGHPEARKKVAQTDPSP